MMFQLRYVLWISLIAVSGCINPSSPIAQTPPAPTVVPTAMAEVAVFPNVLAAQLTRNADGFFAIAVTISSPYDTPQQYADGWRVLAPDGTVLGEHTLLHDHANEQPFTRTQQNVIIPSDVLRVTIEGRDRVNGYGGGTVTVPVDHTLE
ncbi:MAG: hypothetical protein R3E79_56895 [Caldilineaceae bacterium]